MFLHFCSGNKVHIAVRCCLNIARHFQTNDLKHTPKVSHQTSFYRPYTYSRALKPLRIEAYIKQEKQKVIKLTFPEAITIITCRLACPVDDVHKVVEAVTGESFLSVGLWSAGVPCVAHRLLEKYPWLAAATSETEDGFWDAIVSNHKCASKGAKKFIKAWANKYNNGKLFIEIPYDPMSENETAVATRRLEEALDKVVQNKREHDVWEDVDYFIS